MKLKYNICFLILFLANLIFANSESDSIEVQYYFKPVVKTGTKIDQTGRDLTASISVIEGQSLERLSGAPLMNVIKSHVPGLYMTEWGILGFGVAGSAAGKVSMRGVGGTADTHVLVLRNGRPDCMGLMGCTIADEFVTDGVERIEVLRGPASFLYGSNATAGVINIIPRKHRHDGFNTRLTTGYGGYNTQKLSLTHGGKSGNLSYNLSASRRSTDGHRADADNAYTGNFATANVAYSLNRYTTLEVNGSFADFYLFDPGLVSAPKTNDWYDIRRWGGDITLLQENRWGDMVFKVHGNFGNHSFADGWESFDQMLGIMAHQNLELTEGNMTTVGFDLKQYGGSGENPTLNFMGVPSVPYTEETIEEYAPYIHTQQLFFSRFIASAGFRLENHSLFGQVPIPKLGLVFHPNDGAAFKLGISKGFRSPSIRELYFFPTRNEELKPDEMVNSEIGYSQDIGALFSFEGTLFRIQGDNLITLAKRSSGPGFQLANSGSIHNTGYELSIRTKLTANLELNTSWSSVDMENIIPNVPAKKLTGNITWNIGRWFLAADCMWIGDWISKDTARPVPNVYEMDDYALVNFQLSRQITNNLGLNVNLNNALDVEYQAMYGYPMPGRLLLFDLSYTIH